MTPEDRRLARLAREALLFDVDDRGGDDAATRAQLEQVYRRREAEDREDLRRRRRRRWGAAGGFAIAAVGGTAAALVFRGQPSRPEAGVVCRATVDLDADAIGLGTGTDPIDGCRRLWADGDFDFGDGDFDFGDGDFGAGDGGGSGSVPPLVACVGENGAVEVFPGERACEQLGLAAADPELAPENQAIVALQDRLVEEINATGCRPVPDVRVLAEQILAESGLDGWRVVVEPGTEAGICGKASINSSTKTVSVIEF